MSRVKTICAVMMMLAASPANAQTTWYVDDDNCPGPGTGTQADPFCTIQAGIDAAINGDEVLVAEGTYNEGINFNGKAITVRSTDGPDVTTIDGPGGGVGSVVRCISGEGSNTVLQAFTITGGAGTGPPPGVGVGGGMLNWSSSPRVIDCIFTGNTAPGGGGGMANIGSSPTVINCTFTWNTTGGNGGGMVNGPQSNPNCPLSNPTLTNCTFTGNSAGANGDGMYNNRSNPTLTGCTFSGHTGTGLYNHGGSNPSVTNCTFVNNTGGGMANVDSSPTVANCTFIGNHSSTAGGGMYNVLNSEPALVNCLFVNNDAPGGGGMRNQSGSDPRVINCTFYGNTAGTGGGMQNTENSSATIINCILWGDSPGEIDVDGSSAVVVSYSDVQGGWPGTGNIDADPLFVDPPGNLHLSPGSPCIDAGDNTAVPGGVTTDLDGNPRFVDDPDTPDSGNGPSPIVDMGAYEFQGETPIPAVSEWGLALMTVLLLTAATLVFARRRAGTVA